MDRITTGLLQDLLQITGILGTVEVVVAVVEVDEGDEGDEEVEGVEDVVEGEEGGVEREDETPKNTYSRKSVGQNIRWRIFLWLEASFDNKTKGYILRSIGSMII